MRAFLTACLAIIIIVVGSAFVLNFAQRTAAAAYSTDGARINPRWTLRRIMTHQTPIAGQTVTIAQHVGQGVESGECEVASALAWLMVDFGNTGDDNPGCK